MKSFSNVQFERQIYTLVCCTPLVWWLFFFKEVVHSITLWVYSVFWLALPYIIRINWGLKLWVLSQWCYWHPVCSWSFAWKCSSTFKCLLPDSHWTLYWVKIALWFRKPIPAHWGSVCHWLPETLTRVQLGCLSINSTQRLLEFLPSCIPVVQGGHILESVFTGVWYFPFF